MSPFSPVSGACLESLQPDSYVIFRLHRCFILWRTAPAKELPECMLITRGFGQHMIPRINLLLQIPRILNQVKAVNQVDIQIEQGEFVAIVGKSGSGKSTLLHMLGGLDTPTKGSVTLAGKDLYRMKEDALAVFRRRKIGFVFQAFNLVSSVNVWENIVLPLGLDGRKVDEAYVNDIIATLGIENRIYNLPNQLSGGQQQRVAIARALVNRPEIIFADEPTGNLDSKTSDEVIALLKMTAKKYGQTIVMITHDDEIAQVADRILVIEDGQVVDFR